MGVDVGAVKTKDASNVFYQKASCRFNSENLSNFPGIIWNSAQNVTILKIFAQFSSLFFREKKQLFVFYFLLVFFIFTFLKNTSEGRRALHVSNTAYELDGLNERFSAWEKKINYFGRF